MSNKRRKSRGSAKIKRNRLVRVIRGALKTGTPLPGYGRKHTHPEWLTVEARYRAEGEALRRDVDELHESGRLTRVGVAG